MSTRVIPFEKWHGAGNDFIVIDASEEIPDRESFAVRECDRDDGIGADGVLFVALTSDTTPPRVEMTLVQPDGSTAAMCGNGARCAVQWAADRTGSDRITVETPAGNRHATVNAADVTVEMGRFSVDPADVKLARDTPLVDEPINGLRVTAVDTGVPHAVAFVADVDDVELANIAPPIRSNPVFLEGANVTLAESDADGFRQRTFERGVEGETVACGTGAVAIAAVAFCHGDLEPGEPVVVRPPGGILRVTVYQDRTASLTGPVVKEFSRTVDVP